MLTTIILLGVMNEVECDFIKEHNDEVRIENKANLDITIFANCISGFEYLYLYNVSIIGTYSLSTTTNLF